MCSLICWKKYDSKNSGTYFFHNHITGYILRLVKRVFVDTSVLLRCRYAFVLPFLEYCSPVWGSAAECHLQLLERQVYSVARLCPGRTFWSLCRRRDVAALCCMLYKVNSNSNHCFFNELPSASVILNSIEALLYSNWSVSSHQAALSAIRRNYIRNRL